MMALALPLLPAVAALLVVGASGRPRLVGPLVVSALAGTLALGVWAAFAEPAFDWQWSPEIRLHLSVDGFGRVMVILVPLVATPIAAYAAATEEEGRTRLLALMAAFVGAMLLLVSAADFLMLLIGWELIGVTSWALIAHEWREEANVRFAGHAFITTRFGDLGLYVAAGLLFAQRGTFDFSGLAGVERPYIDGIAIGVLLAAAAKSAQAPFSPWLFSAMAGPTPVSALLHSATLVAAGAYLLVRLSPALEPAGWFLPAVAAIGLATALGGGIVASIQTHAKRILAGSTSAQYGLMFIAIGASSTAAAGAQLVAHAAFKSLLFLGAGVAIHATGNADVKTMRLGRALPVFALLSLAGALALAAIPPMGGAWSKEEIVAAAAESSVWLGLGVLVAGFLSALYATRYQMLVWGRDAAGEAGERPPGQVRRLQHMPGPVEAGSMAVLAGVTVLLSVLWLPGARDVVEDATAGELFEASLWEFVVSLALIGAAIGLAVLMLRRHRLASLGLSPSRQEAAGDWLGIPAAAKLLAVDPVLWLSRLLARVDTRVVDAGVRLAAALAAAFSRLFSLRAEWSVDGAVQAIARMTMLSADGSRRADEAGVDGAVEGSAWGVGEAGRASRRLQTGQAHQYYVMLVVGFVAIAVVMGIFLRM
jgi:NADH:ubiquinone oxidoreductase subunit 5 (subunit L)/multisubunit Na+/H+ antiporter MnhA subunit